MEVDQKIKKILENVKKSVKNLKICFYCYGYVILHK